MISSHLFPVNGTSALLPMEEAEAEFAKDRWNLDNIVGVKPGARGINGYRWINFQEIPEQFRPLVKQWCQALLASYVTENCGAKVRGVRFF